MTQPDRTVWFVVPEGVDDPARVSGGNVFDLRVAADLRALGWQVHLVEVALDADTADALARVPAGALVLLDGLVALRARGAVADAADRFRLVLLAHMVAAAFPGAEVRDAAAEHDMVSRARHVVVPSTWVRDELIGRGIVAADRVTVAIPGADEAPLSAGSGGTALLCVGVVAPHKGQDVLVDALADLPRELEWRCTIAGSLDADPAFARALTERARRAGLSERITWAGVLRDGDLDAAYEAADLLVAPSRTESYGIAVGDALRRGIPVVAADVGGIPEAVRPGTAILVPPGDPTALADALRRWLHDPSLRAGVTAQARRAAADRPRWSDTARRLHRALESVA